MQRMFCCALVFGLMSVPVLADHHGAGMTRQEFLDRHARMFDRWDRNGDGVLSADEHAAMHEAHHGPRKDKPARPLMHPSK